MNNEDAVRVWRLKYELAEARLDALVALLKVTAMLSFIAGCLAAEFLF